MIMAGFLYKFNTTKLILESQLKIMYQYHTSMHLPIDRDKQRLSIIILALKIQCMHAGTLFDFFRMCNYIDSASF